MDIVPIVVAAGLPVLAAVFYLEGMMIGKVLQPQLLFVGFVTAVEPSIGYSVVLVATCALSATAGQWTLYRGLDPDTSTFDGVRRWLPYVGSIPSLVRGRLSDRTVTIVRRQFDRHGTLAICATNALPVVRGILTIPAGLDAYPRRPFLLASAVGNCLYVLLYLGVAWGLIEVLRVVVGW